MDAEGRIIPIVEDDMGEGFANEAPPEELERFQKAAAEHREALGKKVEAFERRQAARPEPKKNPHDLPVKWVTSIPQGATVVLMVGIENNRPILFQKAYRIAGSRENGKVILKPALKKV